MADLKTLKKLQDSLNKALTTVNDLITSAETPKEPKEPKEKKAKEAKPKEKDSKEKDPKETKNLSRMTKPIAEQLQKECGELWDEKYKKEFSDFVNAKSKEDYSKQTLESHMVDFVADKKPLVGGGGQQPPDVLTYKQLKELKGLTETDEPGIYITKQGKPVTGPAEISEEEMNEATYKDAEILIGETTKRVYNSDEEFLGYWGVGEFKDADM